MDRHGLFDARVSIFLPGVLTFPVIFWSSRDNRCRKTRFPDGKYPEKSEGGPITARDGLFAEVH